MSVYPVNRSNGTITIFGAFRLGFRGPWLDGGIKFSEKVGGDWLPALDLNLAYGFGVWLAEQLGRKAS